MKEKVEEIEIGGNFHISQTQLALHSCYTKKSSGLLSQDPETIFTSSGREAIKLLLLGLSLKKKSILVPNYLCDSMLMPFKELDFQISFYKIKEDLSVDIPDFLYKVEETKPGMVFFCSYFGFNTLKEIRSFYPLLKEKGIYVLEDLTHSYYSSYSKKGADYYITSLRKWLEIPDGGALTYSGDSAPCFYQNHLEHEEIVNLFIEASKKKDLYLQNLDSGFKDQYRPLFYKINDILNEKIDTIYKISQASVTILDHIDLNILKEKRRHNYIYLLNHLSSSNIEILFSELPANVVPLYLPIYVKSGQRYLLQKYLADRRIYCPIHWSIPEEVKKLYSDSSIGYQNNILSLVIDQRYSENDMQRIAKYINEF